MCAGFGQPNRDAVVIFWGEKMKRVLLVGLFSGVIWAPYGQRRIMVPPLPSISEERVGDGREECPLECDGLADLYDYLKSHRGFQGFASNGTLKYFVEQVRGQLLVTVIA